MVNSIKKLCLLLVLSGVMTAGCSSPDQKTETPNANTAGQPAAAPQPAPPAAPQVAAPAQPTAAPAKNGAAQSAPAAGQPDVQPVSNLAAPRLVVPVKRLDFGKQPKDKSLSRTFVVRNAGKTDLKIEAVEPS